MTSVLNILKFDNTRIDKAVFVESQSGGSQGILINRN